MSDVEIDRMEIELDPLSMLEQSMQVNDYTVTSNGDQDVVMLCDDDQEQQTPIEVPDDDDNDTGEVISTDPPDQVQTVLAIDPSTTALVVPDEMLGQFNQPGFVIVNPQQLQQPEVDESMGFGEHFLLNPGPSYSNLDTSASSPKPYMVSYEPVNGRGKAIRGRPFSRGGTTIRGGITIRGGTAFRGGTASRGNTATRGKTLPRILRIANSKPTNTVKMTDNDYLVNQAKANTKLVNNVKRLSFASADEQSYRQKVFNDNQKVLNSRLDCTVCGKHIGCNIDLNVFMVTHPMLKVLMCAACRELYCKVDWTLGPSHKDTRCRWCSKVPSTPRQLKICEDCPFAFCLDCMTKNYSRRDSNKIMNLTHWRCFVCQMVPLYFMRATCWALNLYIASLGRRKNKELFKKDLSKCCKGSIDLVADEDDLQIVTPPPPPEKPARRIPTKPLSSRIDILFTGIENVKQSVKSKIPDSVTPNILESFISDVTFSLAKIGRNVESCLEYIDNWRLQTIEDNKRIEEMELKRNKLSKQPRKQSFVKINGSTDYSFLLKKYNIKPCSVVLERLDAVHMDQVETSEPPNFFMSLMPEVLIQEINISDDESGSIICLDD